MNSGDLRRSSTTVVQPVEPPPFSRTSTASDSNYASDGHSGFSTASDLSSASQTATPGELELEKSIREKEKMLEEAKAERREIERRLGELERLREEVNKKVELAGIARRVFGYVTEEGADETPEEGISPSEIATYWDSLASDIEGLDFRVKQQLSLRDDAELPVEDAAAGAAVNGANGHANGHEAEEGKTDNGEKEDDDDEERRIPPAMKRADTA